MNFLFRTALAEEAANMTDEFVEEAITSWKVYFDDLVAASGLPIWAWLLLGVMLVGGMIGYRMITGSQKTVWTTKMVSMGSICMALSSVLSLIKLLPLPQGGSVTPASMLPLIVFAYIYGTVPGLMLGIIYGILQCILGPYIISLPQFLLDYPVAFGVIGLAGLFGKMRKDDVSLSIGLCLASVTACIFRYIAAFLSGVIFFGQYAPEGLSPTVYSLFYNGAYMLPETIITTVITVWIGPRLVKALYTVK